MKKILVADDEARIRRLVCDFLKNSGYETIEAVDGKDAIEKFISSGNIDLVICDIMMPELDGFSAVRAIRKNSNVPIIMLSARGEEYDKINGFKYNSISFNVFNNCWYCKIF